MRKTLTGIILLGIGVLLILMVAEMPLYGDPNAPAHQGIMQKYIADSARDTGAINTIAAIIIDYRAYDTLGEATVLFVAVVAVTAALYGGYEHA
jgi:multisubunit Na+/H+ antiporter MnhB subunit